MATPRVFISSTCYDLKDTRFQLRNFIEDFGFEPVMSEFGDIFYNYEKHIQDACLEEINKCQFFALIIGNNYGSLYHEDEAKKDIPDSVTLKEFKKALEVNIYKHIFINKFVNYDYQNYIRALNKVILDYFKKNTVPDDKVNVTKSKLKIEFDEKYYFANESYKYVFYFLDLVYNLKKNNAIVPFESFDDIKSSLRKQWAGFMHDAITSKRQISIEYIKTFINSIKNIENKLNKLLETKSVQQDSQISFDISSLTLDLDKENLSEIQDKLHGSLNEILFSDLGPRIIFSEEVNKRKVTNWLSSLEEIVKDYKWSKYIDLKYLFKNFEPYTYWEARLEVPFSSIMDLFQIYNSFSKKDKESLVNTVLNEFKKRFKPEEKIEDEEIPF